MNRNQQSVILASLLALALAGCSTTKTGSDEMAGATARGPAASANPAPASGAAATAATDTAMPTPPAEPQNPAAMPGMPANAVVVSIETVPRAGAAGSGAVGSSGTSATGSSMGQDKQYRITLHMDEGATRIVVQDKEPTFRNGDRVNMMDGVISR